METIAAGVPSRLESRSRARTARSRAPTSRGSARCLAPLSVLFLVGLHQPAEHLQRPARPLPAATPDALRALLRRGAASEQAFKQAARDRDRAAVGLPAQPRWTWKAFGVLHPARHAQRALVLIGADGVVEWSYEADLPGDLPGANFIFDAPQAGPLSGARLGTGPPLGLARSPARAGGRATGRRLRRLRVPVLRGARAASARAAAAWSAFRHFPVRSSHPRAWPAAARRRGGGAAGPLLGDARRAVRRPGPARGPASVGARRAVAGSMSRASTGPPLGGGRGADLRPTGAPACAGAWPPPRPCTSTASATRGAPILRSSKHWRTPA